MKDNSKILYLLISLLVLNLIMLTFISLKLWFKDDHKWTFKTKEKFYKKCLFEELELNDEQKEYFVKIRNEHFQKLDHLFERHRTTRIELLDQIEANPSLTLLDLKYFADSLGKIETLIQMNAIEYFLVVRQMLDNRQFSMFLDRFREMSGCRHNKHKHHCKKSFQP